jgi:hypothetical protein
MFHPNQLMNHRERKSAHCLLDRLRLLELIGDDILEKSQGLEYLEPIFE